MRKILLSFLLISFTATSAMANMGHRVAAGKKEYHKDLPENSIKALQELALGRDGKKPIMYHQDVKYIEFDIQETADGHLVLFHDKKLRRMLPNNPVNKEAYKKIRKELKTRKFFIKTSRLKIKDLTLAQLKTLTLDAPIADKVPTIDEFINMAKKVKVVKPMVFEIKYINTDQARYKFIQTLKKFRDEFMSKQNIIFEKGYDMSPSGVGFLSFPRNFKKSFPGDQWCKMMKENGFEKVYQSKKHDKNVCDR